LMGRQHQTGVISQTAKVLCFLSIELDQSPLSLIQENEIDTVFGTIESAQRKAVHQYRWKRTKDKKDNPQRYVAACVDHGIAIGSDNRFLKSIEEELIKERRNVIAAFNNDEANMPTRPNRNGGALEQDQSLLDELLDNERPPMSPAPRRIRGARSVVSSPSSIGTFPSGTTTVTLMDREKTVVAVDETVHGDPEFPWSAVGGTLFTLVEGIERTQNAQQYGLHAYEFSSTVPDPRDVENRTLQIVDDGMALLYKFETIPKFHIDDAESRVLMTVDGEMNDVVSVIRCEKAAKTYKTLMTRISKKDNVKKIKIVLPEKVCTVLLNESSVDGMLLLHSNLVYHEFQLDESPHEQPVMNVAWQVALEESITTIENKNSIESVTKGLSKMKLAPKRVTPRK
jgi:hypothetical protein